DAAQLSREHEFDERDLAVIEVGQVDAGSEDATAEVPGVRHGSASQDPRLNLRIEKHEVDGNFQILCRRVVFGVQAVQILESDPADPPTPLQLGTAQIGVAALLELSEPVYGLSEGPAHGSDELVPARRISQDMREELALPDLEASLVFLPVATFLIDFCARGQQAWEPHSGLISQLGATQLSCTTLCDLVECRQSVDSRCHLSQCPLKASSSHSATTVGMTLASISSALPRSPASHSVAGARSSGFRTVSPSSPQARAIAAKSVSGKRTMSVGLPRGPKWWTSAP